MILEAILPPVREVAMFNGYAIAVHGSLKRDIDLIAVAWTDQAKSADELVRVIQGAIGGVLGNCLRISEPTKKPHGRVAYTLIHPGFVGEIDLSVIPPTTLIAAHDAALKAEAKEPERGVVNVAADYASAMPPAFTVSEEVAVQAMNFYRNHPDMPTPSMAATLEKYVPILAAEIVKNNTELKERYRKATADINDLANEADTLKAELSRYREPSEEVLAQAAWAAQLAWSGFGAEWGDVVRAVLAAVREWDGLSPPG